jgi:hypothetical protein
MAAPNSSEVGRTLHQSLETTEESKMASSEDYRKYFCALGSRSVRRVAAKVYASAELDAEVRIAMLKELTEALMCQRKASIVGWRDHINDDTDGEEGVIEIDLAVYSNGLPVFTVVDWLDGYATIVHHPHSLQPQTKDTGELAEELCPCCGGMPETASGSDDDGDLDARSTK